MMSGGAHAPWRWQDLGLSSVALHLGPFDIRWYALSYLAMIGLFWLFWFTDARNRPGRLLGTGLLIYGSARFLLELVRPLPNAPLGDSKNPAGHRGAPA
jgi:prolipoprotein diacylglyceryltransferase